MPEISVNVGGCLNKRRNLIGKMEKVEAFFFTRQSDQNHIVLKSWVCINQGSCVYNICFHGFCNFFFVGQGKMENFSLSLASYISP